MVCSENDTSLNISIPVVMIPKSEGDAVNKSMADKHGKHVSSYDMSSFFPFIFVLQMFISYFLDC